VKRIGALHCLLLAVVLTAALPARAQELEPQRWRHLPIDTNFATIVYIHNDSDIALDPILDISDGNSSVDTVAVAYMRTFALFGQTAQVQAVQPWQSGEWSGDMAGGQVSATRAGLADTEVRVALQLFGAPALKGTDYAAYRSAPEAKTNGGIGLSIQLPTGDYKKDKLINLGNNRFAFRPEIGFVHDRGDWVLEASGTVSFYTDNTSYFDGYRLEQEPLYFVQANVLYRATQELWAAAGAGYANGGRSTVNQVENDDRRENALWGGAVGYTLLPWLSLQFRYIRSENLAEVGSSSNRYILSLSTLW